MSSGATAAHSDKPTISECVRILNAAGPGEFDHGGDPIFRCPTCRRTFGSSGGVSRHHSLAHGVPMIDGLCDRSDLRMAIETLHNTHEWSTPQLNDAIDWCDIHYLRDALKRWGIYEHHSNHPHKKEHPITTSRDLLEVSDIDSRWLPLAHRSYDPIRLLIDIQDWLADRPPYSESVTETQLRNQLSAIPTHAKIPFEDMMLLAHWWQIRHTPSSGTHYANPRYAHGHEGITDPEERLRIARKAAKLATINPADLRPVFGIQSSSWMDELLSRLGEDGVSWGQERQCARERVAQTWVILHERGYQYQEIATAFGMSSNRVGEWCKQYVRDDFEPPIKDGLYRDPEFFEWRG